MVLRVLMVAVVVGGVSCDDNVNTQMVMMMMMMLLMLMMIMPCRVLVRQRR
jgi:hypothetical protein